MKYSNVKPTFQAITNVSNIVLSEVPYRLMCLAHMHANLAPRLKDISALNASLHDNVFNVNLNLSLAKIPLDQGLNWLEANIWVRLTVLSRVSSPAFMIT